MPDESEDHKTRTVIQKLILALEEADIEVPSADLTGVLTGVMALVERVRALEERSNPS